MMNFVCGSCETKETFGSELAARAEGWQVGDGSKPELCPVCREEEHSDG